MRTKPLSSTEAAEYLNISKQSLYRLVSERKLSYYKPTGKLIYFSIDDLNTFVYRNRQGADYELVDKVDIMLRNRKEG
ncbi:MAG: helix-turn-helix domain-containing protein [Treponema sp.]|jgi:excisionase family DNA binding protein|nr:helix-turn-helix domain-containing protein [Treponema sp.]